MMIGNSISGGSNIFTLMCYFRGKRLIGILRSMSRGQRAEGRIQIVNKKYSL
jgi:hypothetical protein